jgi:hypothetical protein
MQDAPSTDRPPRLGRFVLPPQRAAAKLRHGTPLLHDEPVRLDLDLAADRFTRLAGAGGASAGLVEAATKGRIDLARVFEEAFVQHADHVAQLAAFAGVDAALLAALAEQAVAPLRRAYGEALRPLVERYVGQDGLWDRGYCPVCGAWPDLVETAAEGRPADRLRCGACGTTWPAVERGHARPEGSGFRLELGVPDAEAWDAAL